MYRLALVAATAAAASVWPQPASMTSGNASIVVGGCDGAPFRFTTNAPNSTVLAAAFARYPKLLFPHAFDPALERDDAAPAPDDDWSAACLGALHVVVDDASDAHPQLDTDESYALEVPAADGATATARAATVYGALRALETFSQLVAWAPDLEDWTAGGYVIEGAPVAVADAPRFAHRGLMIDTSRHYQPVAMIRAAVDALAYAKLNVLHWHVVDAPSFPFESRTTKALWKGAYARRATYSHSDVAAVVEHARLRGVRVVVEFDMPGHADSWCVGYARGGGGGDEKREARARSPSSGRSGASACPRSARARRARRRSTSRATARSR